MTLIAIAGQSNAIVFHNDGPPPYGVDPLTYIWDAKEHAWTVMIPGVNTGTPGSPNSWGPEVEIAHEFRQTHPDTVLAIVKTAWGSTGLAQDPDAFDWSPESRGEAYDKATAILTEARQSIGATEFDGFFWMQGETDATDAHKAAAYQSNLTDFFSHARADWHVGNIEFGRVAASTPYFEQVRWAQYLVDQADPHARSFDTYAYPMQGDGIHYSASGAIQLGHDLYAGWVWP